jgi:hypothetical protein
MRQALEDSASVGEVRGALREAFGECRPELWPGPALAAALTAARAP